MDTTITTQDEEGDEVDTSSRRVRHEVADGVTLMCFSLLASVSLAGLISLILGLL